MINNKKIIEKYHKKMETINKIEDEFTKSQNKIKLIIDMMMYEKNNKECKKHQYNTFYNVFSHSTSSSSGLFSLSH